MRKNTRRISRGNQRWKAHIEKIVSSHLGAYMANEPDFVAFISAEIADSVEEPP